MNDTAEPGVDAVLARLTQFHPKLIDLSLGRMNRLLAALGDPQHHLPPVVHVAGTNGKGSVIAYLRAMAEAAGLRTHCYTSPHLVRFNERIRLSGRLITDAALMAVLDECLAANGEAPITFFEITTAAAFLAFSRQPADLILLETGLGGRLDATNVIPRPLLSVITPISQDHQQFLGDTIDQIAAEKAGIIKPSVPVVVGLQPKQAAQVIAQHAVQKGAPLDRAGQDWHVTGDEDHLYFDRGTSRAVYALPVLPGPHQIINAGMALAACNYIPALKDNAAARTQGLLQAKWPARLQRLKQGPLLGLLPPGGEIWLDGGHNEAAGHALAAMAAFWRSKDDRPLGLVFGMLATKDLEGFIRPLVCRAAVAASVTIPGEHDSRSAADSAMAAGRAGLETASCASVTEAVRHVLKKIKHAMPDRAPRVLICGSLYLAGTILKDHA